ncbi:hypothetical protein THH46_09735 [Pseudomonas sp. NA13]
MVHAQQLIAPVAKKAAKLIVDVGDAPAQIGFGKIAAASTALRYFLSIEAVIHESGSFVARGCTAFKTGENQLGSNTLRKAGARALAGLREGFSPCLVSRQETQGPVSAHTPVSEAGHQIPVPKADSTKDITFCKAR